MKNLITFLLLSCLTWSCVTHRVVTTKDAAAVVVKDIAYGTDPAQKIDMYLPAHRNTRDTKVLIMIHGGGWTDGDKTDLNYMLPYIQKELPGYAIFNINYREYANGINTFPIPEQDVKAAITYIYNERKENGVSGKFVFFGQSAGGRTSPYYKDINTPFR